MMTHEERRKRRAKIAKYAAKHTDKETAAKFGVTERMVCSARAEHGFGKEDTRVPLTGYGIAACLIRGEKMADVARKYGVSRQFVNIVKNKMRKYGVFDAVQQVASENAVAVLKEYTECVQDADRLARVCRCSNSKPKE